MTTCEPLNLPVPVSGAVHNARWAVEQLRGLIQDWTPPAASPHLQAHTERVIAAIMAVAPPQAPNRVGYAVFRADPIFGDRDYREGLIYTPVSAVFERLDRAENALAGAHRRYEGHHVLCQLTEHQWRPQRNGYRRKELT